MNKAQRRVVGWSIGAVVSTAILLVMWYTVGWMMLFVPTLNITWLFTAATKNT